MSASLPGSLNPMFRDAKKTGICKVCCKTFLYYPSSKSGKYCSLSCSHACADIRKIRSVNATGRRASREAKNKMSAARKGRKQTAVWIENKKKSLKLYWDKRGRKTEKSILVRTSKEYAIWRTAIFTRDNFTCIFCGDNTGGNLEADHIVPFSVILEEVENYGADRSALFDLDNGRTLCKRCHKKTQSYGRHAKNNVEMRMIEAINELRIATGSHISPEEFYNVKMEQFIDFVKEKLPKE